MSENPQPFIPSWLDDLGLTPAQFRVLCHLWRREDTFSNAATIAKICRIKRDNVFKVLKLLEDEKLIRRIPRHGQTTLIEPVPFGGTGKKGNPSRLGGHHPPPSGGHDPSRLGGHKGNPIKAIPLRQSQGDVLPFTSEQFQEAWNDWKQHRKENKKPLTPTSTKQQFKEFTEIGEQRAIAAIHHSIKKGWQGIFEPSSTLASTYSKASPLPSPTNRPSPIEEL